MIDLKGVTVTIDAMRCQKAIVRNLRGNKADYASALKENPKILYTQAALLRWMPINSAAVRAAGPVMNSLTSSTF